MSDYTPTDIEVRSMFCMGISNPTNPEPVHPREAYDGYDRWLAEHDKSVRAEERERIARVLREEGDKHGKGSAHLGALLHDIADSLGRHDAREGA